MFNLNKATCMNDQEKNYFSVLLNFYSKDLGSYFKNNEKYVDSCWETWGNPGITSLEKWEPWIYILIKNVISCVHFKNAVTDNVDWLSLYLQLSYVCMVYNIKAFRSEKLKICDIYICGTCNVPVRVLMSKIYFHRWWSW